MVGGALEHKGTNELKGEGRNVPVRQKAEKGEAGDDQNKPSLFTWPALPSTALGVWWEQRDVMYRGVHAILVK